MYIEVFCPSCRSFRTLDFSKKTVEEFLTVSLVCWDCGRKLVITKPKKSKEPTGESATKRDGKTRPLPKKTETIRLNRWFPAKAMRRIKKGVADRETVLCRRWFIYYNSGQLFFHRSLTGFCIYVVTFVEEDGGSRMIKAKVNRDPSQYIVNTDEEDKKMISWLIDVFLLNRPAYYFSYDASIYEKPLA
jgi:8-oxo-dGTP diphosphatase